MKHSEPLVCVCIPVFNAEATLGATLDSILAQTYANIKIKVFDNASTDQSVALVRSYAEKGARIELVESEVNVGGEGNFTRCIQGGEGEYTAVFHSDDIYYPTMIEEQVRALEADPELGGAWVHAETIDGQGLKTGERFLPGELRGQGAARQGVARLDFKTALGLICKYGNFFTCPSGMVRTGIYREEIRMWNGARYKSSADLDVWLRILERHPMVFLTKALMGYRVSEASYSFRIAKARVTRHDLFLVLDDWLTRPGVAALLSKGDRRSLEFLEFKDVSLRRLNRMRRGLGAEPLPRSRSSLGRVMTTGLQSKFHLKFLVYGLAIHAITLLLEPAVRMKREAQ